MKAWDTLLARLNEVEAIPSTGMDEGAYDDLVDEAGALASALMSMPAPNSAALRWKLDYVMAQTDGGSSNCFSADFLRQTIQDYRQQLTPDLIPETSSTDRTPAHDPESNFGLYTTYRHAKALWDAAVYNPEHLGRDLPLDENNRFREAHADALYRFLLKPISTPADLAEKLQVFRDEGIFEGAGPHDREIVDTLVLDANRIVDQGLNHGHS